MEPFTRNILPRLLGVSFVVEAALLGAVTVDAVAANQPRPQGLVFQDILHRAQHANDDTPYSHNELLAGELTNALAVFGLAATGIKLTRGQRFGGGSPTAS